LSNETNNTSSIISKVWSFCNTLRDDGVGYGDYLEQLTYLLFLKMADEFSKQPYNRKLPIPKEYGWESLTAKKGAELEGHYTTMLRELSKAKGTLGQIFTKSQNKIQDPAKLFKLIDMNSGPSWERTSKARSMKVCWKRTPRIPKAAPGSTLHPAP